MLRDHRLFFRQFRENFHNTGSIAPSSRWLSRALASYVAAGNGHATNGLPRRILEVGPGTGAVTRCIVSRLGPTDRLDLVEMNLAFVQRLRDLFDRHPAFCHAANRVRVLHQPIEDLEGAEGYDAIVSGLPLNNFSPELVARILRKMTDLLARGGTLSFFEYVAVRSMKQWISSAEERTRLGGVERELQEVLSRHAFRRQCVLLNLPPAWVHHVRVK